VSRQGNTEYGNNTLTDKKCWDTGSVCIRKDVQHLGLLISTRWVKGQKYNHNNCFTATVLW
jgi:hypothetical protein